MKGKFDDLESRKPMSRTISMGPDTGDVKRLKKDFDSFDKKIGNEFIFKISVSKYRRGELV